MDVFLHSERLILRRFTMADVDLLVDLDSDPEVMRYLNGGIATPRDMVERQVLPRFLDEYEHFPQLGCWAAIQADGNSFLGRFSLRQRAPDDARTLWLGYRLRREAWGRGYGTEGALALIRHAFTRTDAQRVLATTYEDNIGSRRVMEKAGMTLARTFRMTPETHTTTSSSHVPSAELWPGVDVEYAITRAEWEQTQRSL